jgi:hypothetical protein
MDGFGNLCLRFAAEKTCGRHGPASRSLLQADVMDGIRCVQPGVLLERKNFTT